jgi:inner membrane protein involved in colicin E2 resistance
MIFILYYLLHMKMKKMLLGAFLGMFALAGVAVLPNYASAYDWANPDADSAAISDQKLT